MLYLLINNNVSVISNNNVIKPCSSFTRLMHIFDRVFVLVLQERGLVHTKWNPALTLAGGPQQIMIQGSGIVPDHQHKTCVSPRNSVVETWVYISDAKRQMTIAWYDYMASEL